MVSVPVSLIQMAKFVRKLVELNRCGPSCDGFEVKLFCLI